MGKREKTKLSEKITVKQFDGDFLYSLQLVFRKPLIKAQRSFRRFEKCTSLLL